MGLNKGHTNNPDGRPLGSKNERTKQWEILGEAIISRHSERFNRVLNELDDFEFIKAYTSILAYFKPKLGASTFDIKPDFDKHKRISSVTIHRADEEYETLKMIK